MVTINSNIVNAFTVDLEDWTQSVLSPAAPITDCVLANTDRVLKLLARYRTRATFFALGKICEKFPQLLPKIAAAGHEIASHGYGHELLYNLSPAQFRDDVARSTDIIETQSGRRPIGYRAPAFSITKQTLWAGPVLAELGFLYSSSIFPFAGRRYGIPDAQRFPHQWANCKLIEFPLTTARLGGRNYPASGGGYLRLLPAPFVAAAIRRVHREGQPAVLYMHPYELVPKEIRSLRHNGWRIARRTRMTQAAFRSRFEHRLAYLLERFRFAPMADVLRSHDAFATRDRTALIAERSLPTAIVLKERPQPTIRTQASVTLDSAEDQRSSVSKT